MIFSDRCAGANLYVTEGSGDSFKPAQLSPQLDVLHELTFVDVLAGETRTPAYMRVNRCGQVPYLVCSDGSGRIESNAMLWFIGEGSHLVPYNARDRVVVLRWMFFEQTWLEPNISPARFCTFLQPHRASEFATEIPIWRSRAREALALLDAHLAASDFIVPGHGYSISDIATFGYVQLSHEAGLDLALFPWVQRWIDRVVGTRGFVPIERLLVRPGWSGLLAAA